MASHHQRHAFDFLRSVEMGRLRARLDPMDDRGVVDCSGGAGADGLVPVYFAFIVDRGIGDGPFFKEKS